jgi:thiamine thiazole synthase
MFQKGRVTGLVINWTPVDHTGLHVDPLTVRSKYVVDASGHPSEVARILQDKMGVRLRTKTGKIMGEKSMWADAAEEVIMENTKEIYPGTYVIGMAANAVYGAPRMGPIFGGMLLSGRKVAEILLKKL